MRLHVAKEHYRGATPHGSRKRKNMKTILFWLIIIGIALLMGLIMKGVLWIADKYVKALFGGKKNTKEDELK